MAVARKKGPVVQAAQKGVPQPIFTFLRILREKTVASPPVCSSSKSSMDFDRKSTILFFSPHCFYIWKHFLTILIGLENDWTKLLSSRGHVTTNYKHLAHDASESISLYPSLDFSTSQAFPPKLWNIKNTFLNGTFTLEHLIFFSSNDNETTSQHRFFLIRTRFLPSAPKTFKRSRNSRFSTAFSKSFVAV